MIQKQGKIMLLPFLVYPGIAQIVTISKSRGSKKPLNSSSKICNEQSNRTSVSGKETGLKCSMTAIFIESPRDGTSFKEKQFKILQ